EYFRILEQFGYRYISFEGVIYVIVSGPVSSVGVGLDNVVSALAKTAGVLVFASAVVLVTVNFFRSVSSAAPDSRSMQIQRYIEENPGVGESDIVKGLGYSRGSTVHQLKKLIRDKRVLEKPYHKTVRYYPTESRTREDDVFDAALRREKPAAILSALQKHPMTLAELERETDISRHSLRWHLSRMEEDGIILRKEEAGRVFYSLSKEEK
ncbi:MAG: ArsR family transcriptional regulator, partial [Methanocorpusculaceae archaeon]|nr:ArsR family transcriptional regulator [Methanocorpusculaceae archaeon]